MDGTAAQVERGMTKTDLNPDQIKSIGITAKKEGGRFTYTVPETISFGDLKYIPVVSDKMSFSDNVWKMSLDKPQTIALQINNAHDKVTAQIIFTDAPQDATTITEAKQESLIASLDGIDDIRNQIQEKLLNRSSTEIRTKYKDLQRSILEATNSADS